MKKIICIFLMAVIFISVFAGCGGKDRILYKDADLSEIVKLGEYKGLPVDTSSDTFNEFFEDVLNSDVENNEFYTLETVTEGEIEDGDIANIDYVGKKDGVAFEGGTAEGYDLEIGSGSFIDGFEDGLIGAEIGQTVDLNLTFPEDYSKSPELAGEDVIFTVKVNSAQKKIVQTPEEYYSKLSFKSVSEYNADARKRAAENYLVQTVLANSEIQEYPQEDIDIIYNSTKNAVESTLQEQYSIDFETYLNTVGQTEADYKNDLVENQIKPAMKVQMVLYAILDKEEIEFTKDEINAEIDNAVKEINNSSVTADTIKETYGEYYFEEMVVTNKVIDFLYQNAKLS